MMRKHLVIPGDTLHSIAECYYGKNCDKRYDLVIYGHNRDVMTTGPNNIYVGSELVIPHIPMVF